MYAVIGPIIVFVGVYLKRRNVYDMHHAILGKQALGPWPWRHQFFQLLFLRLF
jgi:hypothetical protein